MPSAVAEALMDGVEHSQRAGKDRHVINKHYGHAWRAPLRAPNRPDKERSPACRLVAHVFPYQATGHHVSTLGAFLEALNASSEGH